MIDMQMIFNYLNDLESNNNKAWFHEHKKERQEAKQEFENFIQELIFEIGKFDDAILHNNPKDLTFKQVRDTRFSHDKSPYNPTFRAHIASKGKLPIPVGYFICIQPHHVIMIGGGLFADIFKDATEMIRDYIVEHGNEFEQILSDKQFVANFQLQGSQLKNIPRGYNQEHLQSQYLKYKSWFVETTITNQECLNDNRLIKIIGEKCKVMKSFNDYLNNALIHFKMPER